MVISRYNCFINIEEWLSVRKDKQAGRLHKGTIDSAKEILPFRNS
jgi:hypothetical protein